MDKRKGTNWIFGLIGGIFFGLITVAEVLLFTLVDDTPWMIIPMLAIFQAVGILFLVFFVRAVHRTGKEREAAELGSETKAELIRCGTNTSINGVAYYFVQFRFVGKEGYVTYKTQSVYTETEAEYLTVLHTFSIKYYGKYAVITEDVSRADAHFAGLRQAQRPPDSDGMRRESAHRLPELIQALSELPNAAAMDAFLRATYDSLDADAFMTLIKTRDMLLQSRGESDIR